MIDALTARGIDIEPEPSDETEEAALKAQSARERSHRPPPVEPTGDVADTNATECS